MTSTAFTSSSNYSPKSILTINSAAMIDRVDFAYLQDTLISNDTNNIITTTSNNKNDDDEPNNNHNSIAATRDQIFELGALTGMICTTFLSVPHDTTNNNNADDNNDDESKPSPNNNPFYTTEPSSPKKQILSHQLAQLFLHLFQISTTCHLDLRTCILKKIQLNGQKYPVELCKGKAGKYTDYSAHTGITTTEGQCTIHTPTKIISSSSRDDVMEDDTTVEGITVLIQNFANERMWNQHHTPRNICLAMMGEVGELAELFQWKKDEGTLGERLTEKELDKVGQELADVAIYLMRLADVCQVGLGSETRKLLIEDDGVEK